jgi:hypothetical protein
MAQFAEFTLAETQVSVVLNLDHVVEVLADNAGRTIIVLHGNNQRVVAGGYEEVKQKLGLA